MTTASSGVASRLWLIAVAMACGAACSGNENHSKQGAGGQGGSSTGGATGGTSSGHAGSAGSTGGAGAAGAAGVSGTLSGGGAGSAGTGGAGASSPEELLDATADECALGCTNLVQVACPEIPYENCYGGCYTQAYVHYQDGDCALEFYEAWACFNRELTPDDFACPGGQVTVGGCEVEQATYNQCTES